MNRGLLIKPRDTDYVFGGASAIPFKAVIPSGDWRTYEYFSERQKLLDGEDTNGCVLFGLHKSIDEQINHFIGTNQIPADVLNQLIDLGYMDTGTDGNTHFHSSPRFTEILTGNGANGNSMPEGCDVVRKYGVIPWNDLLPDRTLTDAQYLDPKSITQAMKDKGAKFLQLIGGKNALCSYHWIIQGGTKNLVVMQKQIQQAPLLLGVAVGEPWDQQIPADPPQGSPPEHVIVCNHVNPPDVEINDNYDPDRKILDAGYPIPYVLQAIVTPAWQIAQQVTQVVTQAQAIIPQIPAAQQSVLITAIKNLLTTFLDWLKGRQQFGSTSMDKFWSALGRSSADPTQLATTAKGLITAVLPLVMVLYHNPNLNDLPDAVYTVVVAGLTIISSAQVIFGIFRKLYLSFSA